MSGKTTPKPITRRVKNGWMSALFGQVFAYSGSSGAAGVSVGVRGPVSVHPAFSVVPVLDRSSSIQITKSVSGEGDGTKKSSDTMGMKHRVDHGVYVFYGSMNPQLATKTNFSDEDAQAIKKALCTLFRNDASSARPEGSMEVHRLYWWGTQQPQRAILFRQGSPAVGCQTGCR